MFIDRGRRNQDDMRAVGLDLRMRYDRLYVGYEFIQWNVLLVWSIGQR
jgi:hypothetical protein